MPFTYLNDNFARISPKVLENTGRYAAPVTEESTQQVFRANVI